MIIRRKPMFSVIFHSLAVPKLPLPSFPWHNVLRSQTGFPVGWTWDVSMRYAPTVWVSAGGEEGRGGGGNPGHRLHGFVCECACFDTTCVCESDLVLDVYEGFTYSKSPEVAAKPKHSGVNHWKPPATVVTREQEEALLSLNGSDCAALEGAVYRDVAVCLTIQCNGDLCVPDKLLGVKYQRQTFFIWLQHNMESELWYMETDNMSLCWMNLLSLSEEYWWYSRIWIIHDGLLLAANT